MMKYLALLFFCFCVWAQSPEHKVQDHPGETEPFEKGFPKYFYQDKAPEAVSGLQKYALDKEGEVEGPANFGVKIVEDNPVYGFFLSTGLKNGLRTKTTNFFGT